MKDSELRMIETMLKKQDELNSAIMKEYGLATISKEQIDLATLDEIGEFTHELKGDWCWWKKSQEPVDRNKAPEELVDIFHFVLIYELLYGKREYFSDSKYNVENPRNYMPVVQMDIAYGIASTLTRIVNLVDGRLMYLLALSEHLGFCLHRSKNLYQKSQKRNTKNVLNTYTMRLLMMIQMRMMIYNGRYDYDNIFNFIYCFIFCEYIAYIAWILLCT